MNGFRGLSPALVEQEQKLRKSLVTPIPFTQALGTSSTTIYTGRDNEYFLIRHISVNNTTAGNVDLTITAGGNDWVTAQDVAANTTEVVAGLEGMLLDAEDDLAGLGSASGLTVFGWGLRIEGAVDWVL